MHKKVQSLVIAGIITVNTLGTTISILADETINENEINIETSTENNEDKDEVQSDSNAVEDDVIENITTESGIVNEGGTGGRNTPYVLKVNTEEGLNQILSILDNEDEFISYYRLKNPNNDGNITTYELHLFDKAGLVSYLNIRVDNNKDKLIERLNGVIELIEIVDMGQGDGTKEAPHKMKVYTDGGLTKLLKWFLENGYDYYKTDNTIEENETSKVYEIYGVPSQDEDLARTDRQYIYTNIVVDNDNTDVINYIDTGIEESPIEEVVPEKPGVEVDSEGWTTFNTIEGLKSKWTTVPSEDPNVIVLDIYTGGKTNPKIEIPREVEGKKVELNGLGDGRGGNFVGVTHIRIEEDDKKPKVKLRAKNISYWRGFYVNSSIEYLDLSGLEVNVNEIAQAFRGCTNLKYLDASGWNVEDASDFSVLMYDCSSIEYIDFSGWKLDEDANIRNIYAYSNPVKTFILKDSDSITYNKLKPRTNQDTTIDVTNLDVKENSDLSGMFRGIKDVTGLETWQNTKNIINTNNMFRDCTNIEKLEISDWDTSNVTDMKEMFRGCEKLKSLDLSKWVTNNVTDIESMFLDCMGLTSLDLTGWDTSSVKNMNWLFEDVTLSEIKGIENWNTSNVTSMQGVFNRCNNLHYIDLTNWSTEKVKSFNYMFDVRNDVTENEKRLLVVTKDEKLKKYNYKGSNRLPVEVDFSLDAGEGQYDKTIETSKESEIYTITPQQYSDLNNIDEVLVPKRELYIFSGWKADKNLDTIFDRLTASYTAQWEYEGIPDDLKVPEEQWQKTRNQEELELLWDHRIENKEDGTKVVVLRRYKGADINTKVEIPRTIDGMRVELEGFENRGSLKGSFPGVTHIRISKGDKTNEVRLRVDKYIFDDAFAGNQDIQYVDLRGLDVSGLTRIWGMFDGCSNLKYINLGGWDVSQLNVFYIAFRCSSLKHLDLSGWNIDVNLSGSVGYVTDNTPNLNYVVLRDIKSLEHYRKLIRCGVLGQGSNLTLDIADLKPLETDTSFDDIFNHSGLSKIIGADIENWDTSNITSMRRVFKSSKISNLDLSKWNTENVTDMTEMFRGCEKLKSLDLSKWDMGRVTNIESMFLDCIGLTSLDLSNWNTSSVTNMNWLFEDVTLDEIKGIENWDTSNVREMQGVFNRCNNLKLIDLSSWDASKANTTYMFDVLPEATNEQKRLLVITKDEKLKKYNYKGSNRIASKLTFNAGDGQFNTNDKIRYSKEIFTIEPVEGQDLLTTVQNVVKEELNKFDIPNKINYVFDRWKAKRTNYSEDKTQKIFEILNDEYVPVWKDSMISVTVPIQEIPFQVVTNLKDKEAEPFIAATLKIQNNNTSRAVKVSVQGFAEAEFTTNDNIHKLELVNPNEKEYQGDYWENLKGEDAIKKMGLGLYVKEGINGKSQFTKETPLWLVPNNTTKIELGILPQAESQDNPHEAKLSFTAKHAKPENFIGGRAKGKFELILIFE